MPVRTTDEVLAELLAESPPGDALPADPDSYWGTFLRPHADALATQEKRMASMLMQVDPRDATDFLTDFERVLGPDPIGRDKASLSIGDRQKLAYQRWVFTGGCSPAFYIALAAALGITITIDQFDSSDCGAAVCGDCLAPQDDQLTWRVNLPATTVTDPVCGAAECGDALGTITTSTLAQLIALYAQPHTLPIFSYSS